MRFWGDSLYFAWMIAFVGAIVSLYFGEVLGLEPCHLCWYQRICLFPLALILGIATYRQDRAVAIYAIPLALIGALFAIYQTLELYFPFLRGGALCGKGGNCNETVFLLWGFLSFPLLSSIGFLLIASLLWRRVRK